MEVRFDSKIGLCLRVIGEVAASGDWSWPLSSKVAADGLLTVGPLLPHAYQLRLFDIVYPQFFETLHNPLASVSFCYGEQ